MRHPLRKLLRRPLMAVGWWALWWGWQNRPTVEQWFRFLRRSVAERRPVADVVHEGRVRLAFAREPDLRHSGEVAVDSVADGVVSLRGVEGGADTRRAELVAARVRGVRRVAVADKVVHVAAAV